MKLYKQLLSYFIMIKLSKHFLIINTYIKIISQIYLNMYNHRESHFQSTEAQKRKSFMPATVFAKLPIAEKGSNTKPLRDMTIHLNTPQKVIGRASVSPMRVNRLQYTSGKTPQQYLSDKKQMFKPCNNHPDKQAKFKVQIQSQNLLYCEKCAILLASQGFHLNKLAQHVKSFSKHDQRKIEIKQFMQQMEQVSQKLKVKKNQVNQIIQQAQLNFENQASKIQQYFESFHYIINCYKSKAMQELKIEFDMAVHQIKQSQRSLENILNQYKSMKQDILSSIDTIIPQAQQHQYRPVMELYNQKLQKFRSVSDRTNIGKVKIRSITLSNKDQIIKLLAQKLQQIEIRFPNEYSQQQILLSMKQDNREFKLGIKSSNKNKTFFQSQNQLFCSFEE